jgi:dCMP deaminase
MPCDVHLQAIVAEYSQIGLTDEDLMEMALGMASESRDPSTQNAAFLAMPNGMPLMETAAVNAFPVGVVNTKARWERPTKYDFVEHAERNAIYAAARLGISTDGMVLVAVWAACCDCARAIIQSGIKRVVRYHHADEPAHWQGKILSAEAMFAEAGVEVITLESEHPNAPTLRHNGAEWRPNQPSAS